MAHVSEEKKQIVSKIVQLMKTYPIVGIVNMENLPAQQLQKIRSQLRGNVELFMTKKRIVKQALKQVLPQKAGIDELNEYLIGMPALLFTKENPFTLFKNLKKNQSNAPARAGQTAPDDIIVNAGATNFAPGPIIGELGALGIKTSVEAGKIAIREPKVVCHEGDVINDKLASMLLRLGIQPMKIGLNLVATYENGTIFTRKVLDIDEEEYLNNVNLAVSHAMSLAAEIGYMCKDTNDMLIMKAFNDSKAVAIECGFLADAVVGDLLCKAEREMKSLSGMLNIDSAA